MHRHEYVEGQDTPYQTVDIPCEVEDVNANGTFDGEDRVWVYVRTWAQRSNASQYQRYWGDAEVIYVTRAAAGGARTAKRDGWRNATLTPLASYPYKEHFEKNFSAFLTFVQPDRHDRGPVPVEREPAVLLAPHTLKFSIADIDTSRQVNATIQWVGLNAGGHFVMGGGEERAQPVSLLVDSVY